GDTHTARGADPPLALRDWREIRLHPGRSGPALRRHARAHSADRGEGSAETPQPESVTRPGIVRRTPVGGGGVVHGPAGAGHPIGGEPRAAGGTGCSRTWGRSWARGGRDAA